MTQGTEMTRRPDRSPASRTAEDEPSAQWGWHGGFPHGSLIAGWASAAILLIMLLTHLHGGHHEGHVADVYLAVITGLMVVALGRRTARARRPWRDERGDRHES